MTRRLLFGYLLAALVVLLVLEIPLAIFFEQREMGRLERDVERDATVLAGYYEEALEAGATLHPAPAKAYAQRTGVRVVVVDKAGTSLIDTAGPAGRDFSTRPEIEAALRGGRAVGTRHSETLNTDLLYVAVPATSAGEVHGAVRLTLDKQATNALVHGYWAALGGIAVVVLVAMAGIGWAIARSVTRPLRELDAAAARFATGDLAPLEPDPSAPPEIAVLGDTMNTMARRLERLLAEQREFVADASHQLRTPLTALRLRLENLQSAAATPRTRRRWARPSRRPAGWARSWPTSCSWQGRRRRRTRWPWTSPLSPPSGSIRGRLWPTPPRSAWTSCRRPRRSSRRRCPAASSRSSTTSSTTPSRRLLRGRASR